METNYKRAVLRIISALHDEKVPLMNMQTVFKMVEDEIQCKTIPYKPSLEEMQALATEAITSTGTDSKG